MKKTAPRVEGKLLAHCRRPDQGDVADARQIAPALTRFTNAEIRDFAAWFFDGVECSAKLIERAVRRLDEWKGRAP